MTYGSIIVDIDTGRPVRLISGRSMESVSAALEQFHSVETVSRDWASAFSKAVESSLPGAIQVADRFHLIKNCSDHIAEQIRRMSVETRGQVPQESHVSEACVVKVPTMGEPSSKKKHMFDEVHRLSSAGLSKRRIARELGINKNTVRKYLQCDTDPGRAKTFHIRYEEYLPIISEGIKENKRITQIHRDLQQAGLDCCYISFNSWTKYSFPEYSEFFNFLYL